MLKTEHSRMRVVAYQKQKAKEYVIGRSRLREFLKQYLSEKPKKETKRLFPKPSLTRGGHLQEVFTMRELTEN